MPKKIPGYSEYQQEQENKRKAKEAAIQEQNRKKTEKSYCIIFGNFLPLQLHF